LKTGSCEHLNISLSHFAKQFELHSQSRPRLQTVQIEPSLYLLHSLTTFSNVHEIVRHSSMDRLKPYAASSLPHLLAVTEVLVEKHSKRHQSSDSTQICQDGHRITRLFLQTTTWILVAPMILTLTSFLFLALELYAVTHHAAWTFLFSSPTPQTIPAAARDLL
jgi:hypothetical protein